jgi:hypothetical protein
MSKLAVLTPSFRGDVRIFADLHRSVQRYTDDDVIHHVVVPDRDVPLFEGIGSGRLNVVGTSTLLPRRFVSTYAAVGAIRRLPGGASVPKVEAINLRRPWPPIRGWILQQIVKYEAATRIDADAVVFADSDVLLIRHLSAEDFLRDGVVRFYRGADPLTPDLVRHAMWHRVSRQLLGLPEEPDDRDYVSSFLAWDPRIARQVRERVEAVTGIAWQDALGRNLHFSEWMLYGCYVDHLGSARDRSFTETTTRCRSHWGTTPLDDRTADDFLASIQPEDLAVLIQSASGTPDHIRRRVIAGLSVGLDGR